MGVNNKLGSVTIYQKYTTI